ncbi:MAG TPA: CBS domain-containing protein, partial [Xanthobacteraceae bacterium]|nr:CBS domain-containing protein [Xanthobacteraceae bacterium]
AAVGTRMSEAIAEMTAKTFGCVGITDRRGHLVGIITDGDLRRHMGPALMDARVDEVMTRSPKTVRPDQLVSETLEILNATKITALFVVEAGRPVGIGERRGDLFSVTQMVEKPPRDRAPSNLIITGRYILQPDIFDILAAEKRGAGDEIQLTDAMIELARSKPFYALEFEGRSFDCGSKVGFLAANIAYALDRSDIAPAMRAELKRLLGEG